MTQFPSRTRNPKYQSTTQKGKSCRRKIRHCDWYHGSEKVSLPTQGYG